MLLFSTGAAGKATEGCIALLPHVTLVTEGFQTAMHVNPRKYMQFICLWALHTGELQKAPVKAAKEI